MARSASFRLFKFKNFINLHNNYTDIHSLINIVPVRYLRRPRKSKNYVDTEMKFNDLLRTLKFDSKPFNPETPISRKNEAANIQENIIENVVPVSNEESFNLVTAEDLIKKFEEKFVPLNEEPYERQLTKKYKRCMAVLRNLGRKLEELKIPIAMSQDKLPCPIDVTLPSPTLTAYRNKDDFSIGLGLNGDEKTVGFFLDPPSEFSTTFCISPRHLPIIKESHINFAEDFQTYIRMSSLPATQHFTDKGYWKNVIVRSNSAEDVMGIIVMHPQDLTQEQLQYEKEKLKDYFSGISKSYNLHSLYFQSCSQSRCTHEQSPFELILGEPCITEEIYGMKINISPDSFFQINTKLAEAMFNSLLKLCRVNKSTTVLDIYCGPGAASLKFSSRVKECIGIDDSIQAINDAQLNAKENGLHNVEFIHGRPESILNDILSDEYHEDYMVILNHNRSGISKSVITTLREFKTVKKVVYITGRPQSAMDNFVHLCKPCGSLKLLGKPFLPILAVPVDLSPQTDLCGLIVMFQRL